MRAIVLCGGRGTRIENLSQGLPKNLLQINGKSILEYQLECFEKCDFKEIYLIAGYGIEALKQFVFNYKGRLQITIIRDDEQLGTGNAIKFCQDLIDDETFLVMGDLLIDFNFTEMLKENKGLDYQIICHTHPTDHIFDSDSVVLDDSGNIQEIVLKHSRSHRKINLALSGIFLLSRHFSQWIRGKTNGDFTKDVLKRSLDSGIRIRNYRSADFVKDLGTEERFKNAIRLIDSNKYGGHHFKRPAIFLDRDGTINRINGYVKTENDLVLKSDAGEGIKALNHLGFLVFVVTNQPVVARGDIDITDLNRIHVYMEQLLSVESAFVDEIKFCPHHPDKGYAGENIEFKVNCSCRKPGVDLITKLKDRYSIMMHGSWVVGDSWRDEKMARKLKINFAKIIEQKPSNEDLEFNSLLEFANYLKEK